MLNRTKEMKGKKRKINIYKTIPKINYKAKKNNK